MIKRSCLTLAFLSLMFLVACGDSGAEGGNEADATQSNGVKEFDLGHVTQESHPFHIGAAHFANLVEEKSNGDIKINIYPSRQLGDDRELLEQIMNGSLDMGVISSPIFGSYTPVLDSLQLPFLINSYEVEKEALVSKEMDAILESLEEQNLKGLSVFEGGMRHVASNQNPINSPEDLEGLDLRVVQSQLIESIFTTFDANPTPMAYGEVYSGLQTGVIDGEEINLTSIYSENHYEVIDYVSLLGQFPFPGVNIMNLDTFNELSKEEKEIINSAADETVTHLIEELKVLDQEAIDAISAEGIEVNEVEDIEPFRQEVEGIYEEYTQKDKLIEDFVNYVESVK